VVFIVAISINLARGKKPDCNCFGQIHSEPVGWPTLVRNGLLVVIAGFVLWQVNAAIPTSVFLLADGLSATALVLIALLVLTLASQWWFTIHLFRQNGRLLLRMDALEEQLASAGGVLQSTQTGLAVGSPAPSFEISSIGGGALITLDTLRAERRPIVLIFSDPACGPCLALLPDIARWEKQVANLTFVLISGGSPEENRAKLGDHRLKHVLLQRQREVADAFMVSGTPGAVLVNPDGLIGSTVVMGAQAIAGLVETAARPVAVAPVPPPAPKVGDLAPSQKLADLNGNTVAVSSFFKRETVVLFWNPSCGFCTKMLPELKQWERNSPTGDPQFLLISSGTVEANRAMGLQSPILLDDTFITGLAFGVHGTPGAILVDAKGRIASTIASGAPAIVSLLNERGIAATV